MKHARIGFRPADLLPSDLKDLPVDFDSMVQTGSIMGGGGMIVMDNRDCVVDLARYLVSE